MDLTPTATQESFRAECRDWLRANLPWEYGVGLPPLFDDLTGQSAVSGSGEAAFNSITLDPADLVTGDNVLAVEVHQASTGSSDLGFDFSLDGTLPPGGASGITVNQTSAVFARARDAGGEWSGPTQSIYVVGTPAGAAV